jgi:hypothetical protein
MSQFMLLLHETPSDFTDLSPEQIQRVIEEYSAWRATLEKKGRMVGGNKLKDEGGRHLSGQAGAVQVTDGPYAEAKEIVGGYFIVEAGDYDEAVEISKSCPHLAYGGRVELREIQALDV